MISGFGMVGMVSYGGFGCEEWVGRRRRRDDVPLNRPSTTALQVKSGAGLPTWTPLVVAMVGADRKYYYLQVVS